MSLTGTVYVLMKYTDDSAECVGVYTDEYEASVAAHGALPDDVRSKSFSERMDYLNWTNNSSGQKRAYAGNGHLVIEEFELDKYP